MKNNEGSPLPLGVSKINHIINFSIAVEQGKKCQLCIFKKNEEKPEIIIEMSEKDAVGEVRFVALSESNVKGKEYVYEINNELLLDPCVKQLVNTPYGVRGKISFNSYDWEGDKPLEIPHHNVVAYTLHMRGFTKHRSSKVRKKGTFLGLIEKIPYLQELGVNQVQCMPIYSFKENPKYKNYWGYGDAFCFAIKQSYAASTDAQKELKDTVKAFHKSGIEVVLNLPFSEQIPKQVIVECLRYYVMEYHVDGFVLNPMNAPMECILSDGILKRTKILQNGTKFQNTMRRFLRGDKGIVLQVMSELKKTVGECGSCNYITNHTGFTLRDLVSYNEKHNERNGENNCDGPTENYSWNCGREGNTTNEEILNLRKKQMRNAMALLMFSQGTPCILAGDEFGNSQNGNNNVYCQDNEIAWLNWNQLEKEKEFFEYVKCLIRIRKEFSVFGTEKILTGTDKTGCGVPDISYHGESAWKIEKDDESCRLGVYYHGEDGTDCFVAYNMQDEKLEFALPQLAKMKKWYRIFSTEEERVQKTSLEQNQQKKSLEARTIAMFVGR